MPSAEPMEEKKDICTEDEWDLVDEECIPSHEECIKLHGECLKTSGHPSKYIKGKKMGQNLGTFLQPGLNATMNTAAVGAGVLAGLTTKLAWCIVSNIPAATKAFYKGFTNT